MIECPPDYRCLMEPNWPPEQYLPIVALIMGTIVLIAIIAAIANRKGS